MLVFIILASPEDITTKLEASRLRRVPKSALLSCSEYSDDATDNPEKVTTKVHESLL